ncbi:hypothetical protein MVEN_01358300 [Mycena venus]|uniref:F-box domain-containing protein n=1 Tax=Mycena venus TaxID=2733690 RepID=A0A8H6Y2B7_9AGAR|nr:hypothetical protein MVEN_01358300 [Mycena venus]
MTIQLPPELIEEVLGHLAEDPGTLRTCSLVCRAWVPRTRSYLFETWKLTPRNMSGYCKLLHSPCVTFLAHVHGIHAPKRCWKEKDSRLVADLRRLTGVRTLTMSGIVHDSNANGPFRTFLSAFPLVTRLVLVSCNFGQQTVPLFDMICVFPALQELRIRDMSGALADPPAIAVPPHRLRSLDLGLKQTGPILEWLHAFNRLSNVDSLVLPLLKQKHVSTVRTALRRLGGALHHLTITLTWFPGSTSVDVDASTVFEFSLHPNLKTLTICDCPWTGPGFDPNRMFQFIATLESPSLERLMLDLLNLSLYRESDWASFDAFLTSSRFPHLRKVVFTRLRWDGDYQFLRGALPLLENLGMLAII